MNRRTYFHRPLQLAASLLFSTALLPAARTSQLTFATPQELIQATIDAAERNDTMALLKLFGPDGKQIVESGDPIEDKESRQEFARAAHQDLQINDDSLTPDRVTFSVGEGGWPFPVPIVRKNGKWQLDSGTGKIELLARRIGRNELTTIEVCRGYAEAQLEYAARTHDGDGVLKYAQRVVSTPGKQDGLYSDEGSSRLVPRAFADATMTSSPAAGTRLSPYHGYYFRMLTSQGPGASGGAFSYVVNNRMIGGFALVAWPAQYGVSGVRTFLINQDGVVYEKDLGAGTAAQARQMTRFSPDNTWRPVVLE